MRPVIILVQVLLSLLVAATLMPVLIAHVPPAQDGPFGIVLAIGTALVAFVAIALLWPRRKSRDRAR